MLPILAANAAGEARGIAALAGSPVTGTPLASEIRRLRSSGAR